MRHSIVGMCALALSLLPAAARAQHGKAAAPASHGSAGTHDADPHAKSSSKSKAGAERAEHEDDAEPHDSPLKHEAGKTASKLSSKSSSTAAGRAPSRDLSDSTDKHDTAKHTAVGKPATAGKGPTADVDHADAHAVVAAKLTEKPTEKGSEGSPEHAPERVSASPGKMTPQERKEALHAAAERLSRQIAATKAKPKPRPRPVAKPVAVTAAAPPPPRLRLSWRTTLDWPRQLEAPEDPVRTDVPRVPLVWQ